MDKWDFIHWGSNFMTGLFWKVQKLPPYDQPRIMCLCMPLEVVFHFLIILGLFLIAVTFEVYEQYFLCYLQTHHFSCGMKKLNKERECFKFLLFSLIICRALGRHSERSLYQHIGIYMFLLLSRQRF